MNGRGGRQRSTELPWASGGARRRVVSSDQLRLLLLSLLGERALHGYELIRAIEQLTDGAYAPSPGLVYPALTVLGDLDQVVADSRVAGRKTFSLTDAGAAELAARSEEVTAVRAHLASLGRVDRNQHAPVRRAMENLKTVLGNSLGRVDEGGVHQITALIDEAAQKIERL